MDSEQLKKLKDLEEENRKLKQVYADLALDNHIKARNLHALLEQVLEHMSRFSNIDFEFNITGEVRKFYRKAS